MRVCVLASGSKGNSTYLETKKHKILIDIGMSCTYIERNLREIGIEPSEIDTIFITHTHSDHIYGLKTFSKKYNPKICFTEKMHNDLDFEIKNYCYLASEYEDEDLFVKIIKTSHDASDSNGYIFECSGKSTVYITDTGYINVKNHKYLLDKNLYILESNHDVEMLMNGKYPHYLKNRVQSDSGHLSNKQCADYLLKFMGNQTKLVVLAHLSEENNSPEKAKETLLKSFSKKEKVSCPVIVAKPKERMEIIKL